jgi:5-methylcytosine-specific restriction endonuclease McrA
VTGRSVPLWEGSTPDAAVPTRVRLRIFERDGGRCALSGRKILPGDAWDLDHKKPLHLGGLHREDNLQVVSRDAHREKSARELTAKAKADRIRAKHIGVFPPSKHKIRSRGFDRRWTP